MSEPQEASGAGAGKKALAAVLVVVFVVVLIVQFGDVSSTQGAGNTPTRDPLPEHAAVDSQESVALDTLERTTPPWPKRELADVLLHDPFALPEEFVEHQDTGQAPSRADPNRQHEDLLRKKSQRAQAVAELQRQGVKAVLGGAGGNVAIIGSQTVRVGDELSGIRVVAIEADGVVLAPTPIE